MADMPRWIFDAAIVIVLISLVIMLRVPIARERKILPAGDAFNFQHITSQIQYGNYPTKEKRLPVYPLLLLPGRLVNADPLAFSVGVSIAAGAAVVTILYALGRTLKLHRPALLLLLGLSIFDPLLTINGMRPLSDSTFLALALLTILLVTRLIRTREPVTPRWLLTIGLVTTLMMFTRYEGFLIAALLFPILATRVGFRAAAWAAVIPLVTTLLWIPAYLTIHGSVTGLAYITDATAAEGGFGETKLIPANVHRMLKGAGWARLWNHPRFEWEQEPRDEAWQRILHSPSWWLGIVAAIGVVWLLLRAKVAALPLVLAMSGYTLLLAWWWVYSRYVAPLSAVFYFTAAAGVSALLTGAEGLRHVPRWQRWSPLLALGILIGGGWIVVNEAGPLHATAVAQAWENNQRGYALFSAIKHASHQRERTAYATEEHAFATLYLGMVNEPRSRINPGLGFYVSRYPEASIEELYGLLERYQIRQLIATDTDSRIPPLVKLLEADGRVQATTRFYEIDLRELDTLTIPVYTLAW